MDRARFEFIGNVGKLEIKDISSDKKMAVISIATSEKWKPDGHELIEKTYWHRVAVFGKARVALIEKAVQTGTRLRLVGQIRPGKWEDDKGQTRYSVEFIVSGLGEVEILTRGKPKVDGEAAARPAMADKARKRANA